MKPMRHYLPNIMTTMGLICGLFVIFKLALTPKEDVNVLFLTFLGLVLLIAGVCDLLDGALARKMEAESAFGELFDSLADAISFGVAPSVLFLKTLSYAPMTIESFFVTTAALIFTISGVLRLVRFNIDIREDKSCFIGLPIPAAAAASISLTLFTLDRIHDDFYRMVLLSCAMALLGFLMVSQILYPSFKKSRFKVRNYQEMLLCIALVLVLLYSFLMHFTLAVILISWGYLLLPLLQKIAQFIKKLKS